MLEVTQAELREMSLLELRKLVARLGLDPHLAVSPEAAHTLISNQIVSVA